LQRNGIVKQVAVKIAREKIPRSSQPISQRKNALVIIASQVARKIASCDSASRVLSIGLKILEIPAGCAIDDGNFSGKDNVTYTLQSCPNVPNSPPPQKKNIFRPIRPFRLLAPSSRAQIDCVVSVEAENS